jgi:hypothetical protein
MARGCNFEACRGSISQLLPVAWRLSFEHHIDTKKWRTFEAELAEKTGQRAPNGNF